MAKNNAECGKREERAIVKALEARGWKARRQPGSGNVDPTLPHDVVWEDSPIGRLLIESKWRATCGWRTLLKWMDGAPILVLKGGAVNQHDLNDPESKRYAFMEFDTLLALVGDAAIRDDLSALEGIPDLNEGHKYQDGTMIHGASWRSGPLGSLEEQKAARAKIAAFHRNPKPKPAKPNKLRGRGFGK